MRKIQGRITLEISNHLNGSKMAYAPPYLVKTYRELVEQIAKLSFFNKDHLLFYRGQETDFRNKAGQTTLYPTIYRGIISPKIELRDRIDILKRAQQLLVNKCQAKNVTGIPEIKRKHYIQWSILQHYEVCPTPLLDLTQSIRVACSFALRNNSPNDGIVHVLGLPYLTNRILYNSEHDLINIRLLSICPPIALRPYFQEGYLAGTLDIVDDYQDKKVLDFNRRLIAKFQIPNNGKFWDNNFSQLPDEALYPKSDEMEDICSGIKDEAIKGFQTGVIGDFIKLWREYEDGMFSHLRFLEKINSVQDALL